MLDNKLIELIETTSEVLDLDESVVEKDYYVTCTIQAISNLQNDYFQMVFTGGTCLAKGHKIVKRMSEDVDFKIQQKNKNYSRAQLIRELKQFRKSILSSITIPGLIINEPIVSNEGRYIKIEITYPSSFSFTTALRPHILLELTLSDVYLPIENLSIRTLIEDTLEITGLSGISSTPCNSINETAIEKWVGLTRRIMAIERGYDGDDPTLIRHVYDLSVINKSNSLNENFFALAKIIVNQDANQFKNRHPEYFANPSDEIHQSLAILKNKPQWKTRYQEFVETMVYDNSSVQDYENTIQTLEKISKKALSSLY